MKIRIQSLGIIEIINSILFLASIDRVILICIATIRRHFNDKNYGNTYYTTIGAFFK